MKSVLLIVVDHQIKRLSGLNFVAWLAEDFPNTIRIMMSGKDDSETLLSAINHGEVFRYLVKPFAAVEVAMAIRDGLDRVPVCNQLVKPIVGLPSDI